MPPVPGHTLATLIRRLRPLPPQRLAALRDHTASLRPLQRRLKALATDWLDEARLGTGDERLANQAAVARWEVGRLLERLGATTAPSDARGPHDRFHDALTDAARAFQLLANGYRFHTTDAVCDGQVLLQEAVQAAENALSDLEARAG